MSGINILRPLWTEERSADLREMWAQGLSASQIGLVLGMSRNAVIGRAHRMSLSQRKPTGPDGGRLPAKPQSAKPRVRRHKLRRTPNPKQFIWETGEPLIEQVHELLGPPVSFIETKSHHCRWIVDGTGVEALCCGVQKFYKNYCRTHARLAYVMAHKVSEVDRARRVMSQRKRQQALALRRAA